MSGAGTAAVPPRAVVAYLVGVGGLAFCIALLWLSMRAVLDIGGACASGGPYVPRVECPDAVIAATPLSILGGFLFGGLTIWGGAVLGGAWAGLVLLAWPALFISLGINFLQYGFLPPGGAQGWVWSWIFCGVVFVVMGAAPLIAAIRWSSEGGGGRAYAGGRVVVRRPPAGGLSASSGPDPHAPIADRLERLAGLRERGLLSESEYAAAKAATLAEEPA